VEEEVLPIRRDTGSNFCSCGVYVISHIYSFAPCTVIKAEADKELGFQHAGYLSIKNQEALVRINKGM